MVGLKGSSFIGVGLCDGPDNGARHDISTGVRAPSETPPGVAATTAPLASATLPPWLGVAGEALPGSESTFAPSVACFFPTGDM